MSGGVDTAGATLSWAPDHSYGGRRTKSGFAGQIVLAHAVHAAPLSGVVGHRSPHSVLSHADLNGYADNLSRRTDSLRDRANRYLCHSCKGIS